MAKLGQSLWKVRNFRTRISLAHNWTFCAAHDSHNPIACNFVPENTERARKEIARGISRVSIGIFWKADA
jgi:hypothetical protein